MVGDARNIYSKSTRILLEAIYKNFGTFIESNLKLLQLKLKQSAINKKVIILQKN